MDPQFGFITWYQNLRPASVRVSKSNEEGKEEGSWGDFWNRKIGRQR